MAVRTVAITRAHADAAEFVSLAESAGITPITLPTIELEGRGPGIVPEFLARAAKDDPDYTIFMSSRAASILFETAKEAGRYDELRLAIANTEVISVGPKTTAMIESHGVRVARQAENHSSVGVGELFSGIRASGRRAIIPRSAASTAFLKSLLEKIGVLVTEVPLYDVRASRDESGWPEFRDLLSRGQVDAIIFTSASSVRGFLEKLGSPGLGGALAMAVGPFTAAELARNGIDHTTSGTHTVPGALKEAVRRLS